MKSCKGAATENLWESHNVYRELARQEKIGKTRRAPDDQREILWVKTIQAETQYSHQSEMISKN